MHYTQLPGLFSVHLQVHVPRRPWNILQVPKLLHICTCVTNLEIIFDGQQSEGEIILLH